MAAFPTVDTRSSHSNKAPSHPIEFELSSFESMLEGKPFDEKAATEWFKEHLASRLRSVQGDILKVSTPNIGQVIAAVWSVFSGSRSKHNFQKVISLDVDDDGEESTLVMSATEPAVDFSDPQFFYAQATPSLLKRVVFEALMLGYLSTRYEMFLVDYSSMRLVRTDEFEPRVYKLDDTFYRVVCSGLLKLEEITGKDQLSSETSALSANAQEKIFAPVDIHFNPRQHTSFSHEALKYLGSSAGANVLEQLVEVLMQSGDFPMLPTNALETIPEALLAEHFGLDEFPIDPSLAELWLLGSALFENLTGITLSETDKPDSEPHTDDVWHSKSPLVRSLKIQRWLDPEGFEELLGSESIPYARLHLWKALQKLYRDDQTTFDFRVSSSIDRSKVMELIKPFVDILTTLTHPVPGSRVKIPGAKAWEQLSIWLQTNPELETMKVAELGHSEEFISCDGETKEPQRSLAGENGTRQVSFGSTASELQPIGTCNLCNYKRPLNSMVHCKDRTCRFSGQHYCTSSCHNRHLELHSLAEQHQ